MAVDVNRAFRNISINSIRSVHYRNTNAHVANWIEEGLTQYADRKRMSEWLNKQRYNSADVKQLFGLATNIINTFKNPSIYPENNNLYRVGDKENPLAINDKFNEDLSRMISGNLKIGHTFELGNPNPILRSAGLPDLPIQLNSSRLRAKSKQEEHPFDLSEIADLPLAVQNPLAVFRSTTDIGSYVIFTDIPHKGENFIVAIEVNRTARNIAINSIRSIHYKKNSSILNWLDVELHNYLDKKRMIEWLNKQRSNSADVRQSFNHYAKIINTFKNPTISLENNNLFRVIGERGASRLNNAEKVLDGLRAAKEMESIGNADKLKDVVLGLFHKSAKGDVVNKSISIGKLTKKGREYLAGISGLSFKEQIDFMLNPSDLKHIYNNHYGKNEKDKGNNKPLNDEDIRSIVDVVHHPDEVVFLGWDKRTQSNKFAFLKKSDAGTYNLLEVYSIKNGNLTAKTFLNVKKSISQRVMELKRPLLSTSETYFGESSLTTRIPQLFESIKSYDAKTIRLATGWERGKDGRWRYETRDIELKKDIDFIGKLKTQNEAFTEEVPLTEVIEDEELFNSYPEIKDVKLVFYNYGSHPELAGTGAFSDLSKKIIGIGTKNEADDQFITDNMESFDDETDNVVKDIMDNPEVKAIIPEYSKNGRL